MNFVMSTLTNSVDYAVYAKVGDGVKTVTKIITVKGGSYRRDPKTLQMAQGVVTEVSDADLEILRQNPLFKQHEKNGEHIVVKSKKDASKAKKDGAPKDGSAQLTPEDYEKEGKEAPKTVKQANEDDSED
jgi:tRNA A37 threonylcarbamoyladenosine dehydratase